MQELSIARRRRDQRDATDLPGIYEVVKKRPGSFVLVVGADRVAVGPDVYTSDLPG
jgi:hypothetical protein